VGFGFELRARSRKGRGLFRKAPDPREVGDRFGRLLKRMHKEAVRAAWKGDRYLAELTLNPLAPPVSLVVGPDAEIHITGDAWLGPGLVAEVVDRVAPVLEELDFVWAEKFDLAATQAQMCARLADELRGPTPVRIAVPKKRKFRIDAPVLTALGPRDAAWRDAVLADPMRGADAFAWWQSGPGQLARARALVTMWHEVPWREPLDADERETMKKVDEDLRVVRQAKLDLPWAAWKELLAHLGIEDEEVDEHAGPEMEAASTIGYRRFPLEVELSGGWFVDLPGAMVGHWEDEGARYWATDGDRVVEFTSLTAAGEDSTDKLLSIAPEAHPVVARIDEATRKGRAEAFDEGDVHIVVGLTARAPHVGILTCKGGTEDWALSTWRSLRIEDGD